MAKLDPEVLAHLEWLGFVQPTGLVVSAPALVRAGAHLQRNDTETQRRLRETVVEWTLGASEEKVPVLPSFRSFAAHVLGWSFSPKGYAGTSESAIPDALQLSIEGELLRPDFAVRERDPQSGKSEWQLLVRVLENGESLDKPVRRGGALEMSEHSRTERLLRQTGVPAGLIFNGRVLRLLSAPYGETSGWLDFKVDDMLQTAGRPIAAAMKLLLGEQRLLALPKPQRLAALLDDSRKFQNEVSERLAEQVLHALYELLRGFQHANDRTKGDLLRYTLNDHPDEIYRGLLTVLLRLVFLKYAEERDMLPEEEVYLRNYSLGGLYERLRKDAALYPDTMGERYGAWPQLLALFRIVHDGADAGGMHLPKRHGVLFDPDRYPFLEGRFGGARQIHERIDPPLVPDRTVFEVLENLLVLDGERISYRALDVEQIGSVYETMMGFRLERTTGPSVAIKAQKKHGAPTAIDLEELLGVTGEKREKWIAERTERKIGDKVKKEVKAAATVEDLHAALLTVIDKAATPDVVPPMSMVLQPSEERRRSGSHYTPRSLTDPIVRTTLEPIFKRLRGESDRPPSPEQILGLKVCDPAMGSGAFLVEACRQLGDALVESWRAHDAMPQIPADEDEIVYARRLVAQRCLYGVDRNPMAVDLAKVSLWLVTLAKEHSLTFVDHALRHGDSLVGLSRKQIEAFQWDVTGAVLKGLGVREPLDRYLQLRRLIREADEKVTDRELNGMWAEANRALADVRLFGDLVMLAFFEGENAKARDAKRVEYASAAVEGKAGQYHEQLERLRHSSPPLAPFHWEIEFPEVFVLENGGFDAIAGNPPFAGKNSVISSNVPRFLDWLKNLHEGSHGNSDLVAHFFRRSFALLKRGGCLGLIAKNTIAQGDTRGTGLRWICSHGGEIFAARRRQKWPGRAAVIVSEVHICRGATGTEARLDDRVVPQITAYLVERGNSDDPSKLSANVDRSFVGCYVLGVGFTFDDSDTSGRASPISDVRALCERDPRNRQRIFPYLNGDEVNSVPSLVPQRFVIDFGQMELQEARRWPDLIRIVEERVKPERLAQNDEGARRRWWQFIRPRPELRSRIVGYSRVLVRALTSKHFAFVFLPAGIIYDQTLIVFALEEMGAFSLLQSRLHERWADAFGGTLEDRPRYNPEDCFETFPFPTNWQTDARLQTAGNKYYDFRAALMVQRNEGLTRTYNRFHDPEERDPDILKLRELHAAIDRAVLDAYGWTDIPTEYEFLLDYEIDEEEWGSKKKPYRYRWPDDVRDEVLARLLELNAQRSAEEARSGVTAQKTRKKSGAKKSTSDDTGALFG